MANEPQKIDQSHLSEWVTNSRWIIKRKGTSGHTDYFYICAPSFLILIKRNSTKDSIDIRNVAKYTGSRWEYYTGNNTWSTTEPSSTIVFMNVPSGQHGPYYWGHNADLSKRTGISSYRVSTEEKVYLWRFGIYCKGNDASQEAKFWAGPIGIATESWYTANIKGKLLQGCGANALTSHTWDAVNEGSQTDCYLWHSGSSHDYAKNDSGAVNYFGIGSDRGNPIYTYNSGKLCYRGE